MFNVKVEQLELMDALRKVKNTVGKGKDATNPYDKYLYMQCLDVGGKATLRLMTTNLSEVSDVNCEIVSNGGDYSACSLVDFNIFHNLIDTIDSSTEIDIVDTEHGKTIDVNYAGRKKSISFSAFNATDFVLSDPNDSYDTSITMNCGDFKECIDKVSNIIVENESYPLYNCAHFTVQNGQIVVKAMDSTMSKRMTLYSKMLTHTGDGVFFVECSKAKRVIGGLDSSKDLKIGINDNVVALEQDGVKFFIRLITGTFPSIEKFMPNQYKIQATINRDEAITALKRVKIMSDQGKGVKSCVFSINNVFTNIDINSQLGAISEIVTTQLSGDPLEMAFSIDAVLSSLYAINEPDINMCFYANQCCVLMPANQSSYIHRILVPAMVNRKA